MTYHEVTCERVQPPEPEAYICAWGDRHKLALGLLGENKATRTSEHQGIKDAPGITGHKFALVTIERGL